MTDLRAFSIAAQRMLRTRSAWAAMASPPLRNSAHPVMQVEMM